MYIREKVIPKSFFDNSGSVSKYFTFAMELYP